VPDISLKVEKSVLEGGVKVLSVDTPTPTTTLSLFVKAGSRYENRQTLNSAHFLKRLAFKGTHEKSAIRLIRDLEHIGSTFSAEASREYLSYRIQGLRFSESADSVNLSIEAETLRCLLNPLLLEYELERVRPIVDHDVSVAENCRRTKAFELTHAEAFKDTGLGNPLYPTSYGVSGITPQKLHAHVKNFFYPGDRVVIVATGVNHSVLVKHLTPLFTNPQLQGKYYELKNLPPLSQVPPTPQKSSFNGGSTLRIAAGGNSHIVLSFGGVSASHQDQVALALLASILGKGSKELTGPGDAQKSSPLNNVVSSNSWLRSAEAFSLPYSDAGLFGVYSVASEGNGAAAFSAIHQVVTNTLSGVTESLLDQAKRYLKIQVLRNIGGDRFKLAEHIMVYDSDPLQYLQAIDAVKINDVQRVAKSLSSSKPILVAVGDVTGIPKL